jgi:hypothetical protein
MKTASPRTAWTDQAPGLYGVMVAVWRALSADLFNGYRPEKHYMRGPGPKWHALHSAEEAALADAGEFDGPCPAT